MADCKIVNAKMVAAVDKIAQFSKDYREAGENLKDALNAAIASMEGETKDAMQKFFDDSVAPFVTKDLPDAIQGLSDLLEANRSNFEEVDKQIADSISGS